VNFLTHCTKRNTSETHTFCYKTILPSRKENFKIYFVMSNKEDYLIKIEWKAPEDGALSSNPSKSYRALRALELAVTCARDFDTSFQMQSKDREGAVPEFHPDELVFASSPHRIAGFYKEYILQTVVVSDKEIQCGTFGVAKYRLGERIKENHFSVKYLQDGIYEQDHASNATTEMILEAKILMSLAPHPHISQIYGVSSLGIRALTVGGKRGYFFITDTITETLVERMDSWRDDKAYCASSKPESVSKVIQRLEIALDIASALVYLHDRNLVVCIRPDKIGFDARYGRVKLFQFGQTRQSGMESHPRTVTQSDNVTNMLAYTAPEVFCQAPANPASDVYGFGILLWEMMSLERPFSSLDRANHFEQVVRRHVRPSVDDKRSNWDQEIASMIKSCWHPYKRLPMKKVHADLEIKLLFQEPSKDINDSGRFVERYHSDDLVMTMQSMRRRNIEVENHGEDITSSYHSSISDNDPEQASIENKLAYTALGSGSKDIGAGLETLLKEARGQSESPPIRSDSSNDITNATVSTGSNGTTKSSPKSTSSKSSSTRRSRNNDDSKEKSRRTRSKTRINSRQQQRRSRSAGPTPETEQDCEPPETDSEVGGSSYWPASELQHVMVFDDNVENELLLAFISQSEDDLKIDSPIKQKNTPAEIDLSTLVVSTGNTARSHQDIVQDVDTTFEQTAYQSPVKQRRGPGKLSRTASYIMAGSPRMTPSSSDPYGRSSSRRLLTEAAGPTPMPTGAQTRARKILQKSLSIDNLGDFRRAGSQQRSPRKTRVAARSPAAPGRLTRQRSSEGLECGNFGESPEPTDGFGDVIRRSPGMEPAFGRPRMKRVVDRSASGGENPANRRERKTSAAEVKHLFDFRPDGPRRTPSNDALAKLRASLETATPVPRKAVDMVKTQGTIRRFASIRNIGGLSSTAARKNTTVAPAASEPVTRNKMRRGSVVQTLIDQHQPGAGKKLVDDGTKPAAAYVVKKSRRASAL
jgi:Protein tyrosine and serine/threonine kinase